MDNRTTSPPLKEAFAAGVLSTGLDVVDIGINHTPLLYFAVAHWKLDGGATVTGSHNPVSDNGVKMVHAGAAPLTEEEIQGLLATITSGDFERGAGARTTRNPRNEYFDAITSTVKLSRRLKVVADAGNGIAGSFAPELLRRLGAEVIELFCESDGTFPNHLPDPEMEENTRDLVAKVIETRADIGLAYDGDADRVGVVDERGRRHEADLILALLARDLLDPAPGRAGASSTSSPRRPSWTTCGPTAASPSCGRRVTPTSSARCGRTGSCWAARSRGTCSSARTGTAWTTASWRRARSSS